MKLQNNKITEFKFPCDVEIRNILDMPESELSPQAKQIGYRLDPFRVRKRVRKSWVVPVTLAASIAILLTGWTVYHSISNESLGKGSNEKVVQELKRIQPLEKSEVLRASPPSSEVLRALPVPETDKKETSDDSLLKSSAGTAPIHLSYRVERVKPVQIADEPIFTAIEGLPLTDDTIHMFKVSEEEASDDNLFQSFAKWMRSLF